MPDTNEKILDECKKRVSARQFLGKHMCSTNMSGTIEKYLNTNTGEFEWYYIIDGFYNAEWLRKCPFCNQIFEGRVSDGEWEKCNGKHKGIQ